MNIVFIGGSLRSSSSLGDRAGIRREEAKRPGSEYPDLNIGKKGEIPWVGKRDALEVTPGLVVQTRAPCGGL